MTVLAHYRHALERIAAIRVPVRVGPRGKPTNQLVPIELIDRAKQLARDALSYSTLPTKPTRHRTK